MLSIYLLTAIVALMTSSAQGNPLQQDSHYKMDNMNTHISLSGAEKVSSQTQNGVVIDPATLIDEVSESHKATDIQEDPEDRFITTRSGKPRRNFVMESSAEEWSEETLTPKVLSRVKRCGGGGGGNDDDGNANRARRARRARRTRIAVERAAERAVRKAVKKEANRAKKASKTKKTVVTTKVIKNGQVVSETTQTEGAQNLVQQQQPQVVQTQQAPQVVVPQQVVTTQPQHLPSISVQGSIKVN